MLYVITINVKLKNSSIFVQYYTYIQKLGNVIRKKHIQLYIIKILKVLHNYQK